MNKKRRCANCKHIIWFDEVDKVWRHKHYLHNDNCPCRNPVRIKKESK